MWILAVACRGPSDEPAGPDADPDASAVALLGEALADRCPDVEPGRVVPPGTTMHRVTLSDAAARCNDGTPPVLYVRAATDPDHAADWVIHLEGGGICEDHDSCAARWCGVGVYDAGNMSSAWSPEMAAGLGIASPAPSNRFAGWNQVSVHYCSSDLWSGAAGDVVLDGDPPYRLHFDGQDLLGEVFDALEAGVVSDNGTTSLSALQSARTVLFGGSSAGGYGTLVGLQRVVERLPGATVIGLPDAVFSPAPGALSPDLAAGVEAAIRAAWAQVGAPVWGVSLDPTCLAAVGDEVWRCFDMDHLLRTATVPVVYHHDLLDPVLYDFFSEVLSFAEYASTGEASLRGLAALPSVSVHGSTCGDHTALDGNPDFFGLSVVDAVAGGPAVTLHDAVAAAVEGDRVIAVDSLARLGSDCP